MNHLHEIYTVSVGGFCRYVSHDPNIKLQGWASVLDPNSSNAVFEFQSWENRYPEDGYNKVDYVKKTNK